MSHNSASYAPFSSVEVKRFAMHWTIHFWVKASTLATPPSIASSQQFPNVFRWGQSPPSFGDIYIYTYIPADYQTWLGLLESSSVVP